MIANVKFHVTRCHAVTLYKSVTLPPVDQIIIWPPNSVWSTKPYILLRHLNSTIIRSKVQSSLSQILQPGLPSSVSLNCSCSSCATSCRHWLLSSHFSANWIRILAWASLLRLFVGQELRTGSLKGKAAAQGAWVSCIFLPCFGLGPKLP